MTIIRNKYLILTSILLMIAGLMVACSSDSPTKPQQQPTNPPGTAPPSATWNIAVSATPDTLETFTSGDELSVITVRVTDASTGAPPPNETSIQMTTSHGSFESGGQVQSTFVSTLGGVATLNFYVDFGTEHGVARIQARLEDSYGQAEIRIIGGEGPYISHLEPSVGRPEGGYAVNIIGGGFSGEITASLGGLPAEVMGFDSDSVRIRVPGISLPTGQSRTVSATVNYGQGTPSPGTISLGNAFTYAHGGSVFAPEVFSISPTQGPNEGGYQAVIRGANFDAPSQVLFGDSPEFVEATIVSIRSNEIVVIVPSAVGFGQINENQTVDVTVRSLNTGLEGVLADGFTYGHGGGGDEMFISSMGPTQGPMSGGTLVTIYGFGFKEPVSVTFGSLAQQVISVSGTEVVVRTVAPERASCGDLAFSPVRVVNIETNESASAGITYTYQSPAPILLGVSPASGAEGGGNTVTLSGVNFEPPAVVQFGGSSALITTVVSSTTTTAVVPPYTGALNVEACDDNNDGTLGERYLPTAVDVTWDNPLYSGCSSTLTNGYTYNPSDTSCRNDTGPVVPVPPSANFTWSPAFPTGALPLTVQFTDLSGGGAPIVAWSWNFGDGAPPSLTQNPSHDFTSHATFNVSLTVTDSNGATASITQSVTTAP